MEIVIPHALNKRIQRYYLEAGPDYRYWSPGMNMHFGLARPGQFWHREAMLNALTDHVVDMLQLDRSGASTIADFGCGTGAAMRRAAAVNPTLTVKGVTIVEWQKHVGDAFARKQNQDKRIEILLEDYHKTSINTGSMDGVYAMESTCYSPAALNETLFTEVHRVLRSGARLVIADGFLKVHECELSGSADKIYRRICHNWSLPGLMNIHRTEELLLRCGFRTVIIKEISMQIAPSVLHVPFVIMRFILDKWLHGEKLSGQSVRNLLGSFQTILLGLNRRSFGYFIISAQK